MRTVSKHPNVIKLYETYVGEKTYYFVMELIEGGTMWEDIKRRAYKENLYNANET
jgi:serine/threonine protein kinase